MYGAHFSIGPDGDCYLVGRTLLEHLDVAELDRIIGVLYELVERWFQPAVAHRASARRTGDRALRPVRMSEVVLYCVGRAVRYRSTPTVPAGPEVQDGRFVRGSAKRSERSSGPSRVTCRSPRCHARA